MREPSSIRVRRATAADAAPLGKLAIELVRMHHALDPRRFLAPSPETETGYGRWLAREAQRDGAVVLAAVRDDALVGYAYATVEGRNWNELLDAHGKLHDVFVAEDARGNGIASLLLAAVRDALVATGCERIVLSTSVANERAQRLFTSFGFRPSMIEMTWNDEAPARSRAMR